MLKVVVHSALIVVVLLSQLYNSFVVAGYQLNYEYYSQELCENKDQPELHCDGKCMLAKQLAVHQDSEKQGEAPTLLPSPQLFSMNQQSFPDPLVLAVDDVEHFIPQFLVPDSPMLNGIEHPPRA